MNEIYTFSMIISLIIFAIGSSLAPGPSNIILLSSGLNFGYKRTIPHILGVMFSFPLMIVLMGLGLEVVFKTYPVILDIVKYIGIAYLAFVSFKILTAKYTLENKPDIKPFTFMQSVLFQWVNPKAWIFSVSVVSLYITSEENSILQLFVIVIIFVFSILLTSSCWSYSGVLLKRFINNEKYIKLFNIGIAVMLILSIIMILAEG